MKIKKIIAIILIAVLSLNTMYIANADIGYDVTAPVIQCMEILDNNVIDSDGTMKIAFQLVEEGVGVNQIGITFVNSATNQYIYVKYEVTEDDNNLLFSGMHEISLDLKEQNVSFAKGKYDVYSVAIYDVNGNKNRYFTQDNEMNLITKYIYVQQSGIEFDNQIIQSLKIDNPEYIEYGKYFKGTIKVSNNSIISGFEMVYRNDYYEEVIIKEEGSKKLSEGINEIDMYIAGKTVVSPGDYYLSAITIETVSGEIFSMEETRLNRELFTDKITISKLPDEYESEINIHSVEVAECSIVTPGVITLNMDWNTGEEGISGVSIGIANENGNKKALHLETSQPMKNKKESIKFPVNTYLENGSYHIEYITIYSKSCSISYSGLSLSNVIKNYHDIEINSKYDIVYYGSTSNTNGVVNAINHMKSGEVAIAEYSIKRMADKKIFEALAGKDVTLVFEGPDIQWVFYGKDINLNDCKPIDLAVNMRIVKGEQFGYQDDKNVLAIEFADNGKLPGKAKIRISNEYLKAKYGYKTNMVLSYYGNTPEVLSEDIGCATDGYAEIEITHNSTYILSDNLPRLAAPGNFNVTGSSSKNVTLSWSRVYGAAGYKIYRSNSNGNTYTLIKTIEGNDKACISYNDKTVSAGKKYYYRVCGYGKNVKAIYSSAKSIRVRPGRTTVTVKYSNNKKVKLSMKTADNITNFVIYISKNGKKYKKIKTTNNKKVFTFSKKKYGGYYIKVRAYAKNNGKKYYGKYSKVQKIKN